MLTDSQQRALINERHDRLITLLEETAEELARQQMVASSRRQVGPEHYERMAALAIRLQVLSEVAGVAYGTLPAERQDP